MSYGNPYFASAEYRTRISISAEQCIGCATCAEGCPQHVIGFSTARHRALVANLDRCVSCYKCIDNCPVGAITVVSDEIPPQDAGLPTD